MIDRGLTPEILTALAADETAILLFVDVDWPTGRVRAHTGLGDRQFMGETYVGIGEFGGVSEVAENPGSSPNQIRLTLKVIDAAVVALVMNNSPEGREIAVHMAVLDENRVIAHEIPYIFDGNIANFTVQRGDIDKGIPYVLQLTCSDWLERWSQPPNSARTTNAAQQHLYPGDRIFDLTEIIAASPLSSLPVKRLITTYNNSNGRYEP